MLRVNLWWRKAKMRMWCCGDVQNAKTTGIWAQNAQNVDRFSKII
jgi:hypothetical protein